MPLQLEVEARQAQRAGLPPAVMTVQSGVTFRNHLASGQGTRAVAAVNGALERDEFQRGLLTDAGLASVMIDAFEELSGLLVLTGVGGPISQQQ